MPQELIPGLTIDFEPDAPKEIVDAIHAGLDAHNRRALGSERYAKLRLIARDSAGRLAAGLLGHLYFEWLFISALWVREDLRGRGIGSQLMARAEEYATVQGRTHVHLDTFDFQAPDFYQRLGYTVFGELGPYGDGHIRYYLKKELPSVTAAQTAQ